MEIVHLDERRYAKWRERLGTEDARHVRRRLRMLTAHGISLGLPNVRPLFGGVWELRTSAGHRLYFVVLDDRAVFLAYGHKDTQLRDIERAMRRAGEVRDAT